MEKEANANRTVSQFFNDLDKVDQDITRMMFGENPIQMWESINPLSKESKSKVATLSMSNDIRKELHQLNLKDQTQAQIGITKNKEALEYAKTIKKHVDPLLDYLNIERLDGHAGIQRYNSKKMKAIDKKTFSNMLIDEYGLDLERMFGKVKEGSVILDAEGKFKEATITNEFKSDKTEYNIEKKLTRKQIEDELFYIKEEIDNGSIVDNIYSTGNNLQKRRVIHFKDIDTQIRFNDNFNYGENILLQYRDTISSLAEKQFIYDSLGSNPLNTINTVVQHFRETSGSETMEKVPFTISNGRIVNQTSAREHVGHYLQAFLESSNRGYETNETLASVLRTANALTNLRVLPKIAVSYVADTHNILFSQALQGKKVGLNTIPMLTQRFKDNIVGLLHSPFTSTSIGKSARGKAEKILEGKMKDSLGRDIQSVAIASHRLMGNINRYISEVQTGVSTIDGMQNMLFRSTHMIDSLQKISARDMISANIIQDIGLKFSELPKERQHYYKKYGIADKEWEIARKKMIIDREEFELKGKQFRDKDLLPDLAMNLSDADIKILAKADILENGRISSKSLENARKELRDKFDVLYNRTIAQMMGEDRFSADIFFKRNTKAGTISGELARGFGKLQSYSLGFYRNMMLGILNHPVYKSHEKLGMLAAFPTIGAFAGALPYYMLKDVLAGKQPNAVRSIVDEDGNLDFKEIIGLYEYSGGLTIWGEYALKLYGESRRSNAILGKASRRDRIIESVFGPTIGPATTGVISLFEQDVNKFDRDWAIKTATRNLPNVNILQPTAIALLNMNFLLSDEKVEHLKSSAEEQGKPYFIPTK